MSKTKIRLDEAQRIARHYLSLLAPACERIEVAGSIRRKKPLVGDIEMVAIPKLAVSNDLFGNPSKPHSLLDDAVADLIPCGARLLKNGERYKQIALPEGVNLDLFIVLPPAQWGVIFLIRTGPADFSRWVVTPRRKGGGLPSHLRVKDGAVWQGKEIIPTPTEADVFRLLGMEPIPPARRRLNTAFSGRPNGRR